MPILAPLQASQGGPVVAVQVENEYGSYGDDKDYLRWNRQALMERGIIELLFTADGGTDYFLDGGALDGHLGCGHAGQPRGGGRGGLEAPPPAGAVLQCGVLERLVRPLE